MQLNLFKQLVDVCPGLPALLQDVNTLVTLFARELACFRCDAKKHGGARFQSIMQRYIAPCTAPPPPLHLRAATNQALM
jgi:hypothetical protein